MGILTAVVGGIIGGITVTIAGLVVGGLMYAEGERNLQEQEEYAEHLDEL